MGGQQRAWREPPRSNICLGALSTPSLPTQGKRSSAWAHLHPRACRSGVAKSERSNGCGRIRRALERRRDRERNRWDAHESEVRIACGAVPRTTMNDGRRRTTDFGSGRGRISSINLRRRGADRAVDTSQNLRTHNYTRLWAVRAACIDRAAACCFCRSSRSASSTVPQESWWSTAKPWRGPHGAKASKRSTGSSDTPRHPPNCGTCWWQHLYTESIVTKLQ